MWNKLRTLLVTNLDDQKADVNPEDVDENLHPRRTGDHESEEGSEEDDESGASSSLRSGSDQEEEAEGSAEEDSNSADDDEEEEAALSDDSDHIHQQSKASEVMKVPPSVPEELLGAAVADHPASNVEAVDVGGSMCPVEAVLYKIDGNRLEMVHPRALVQVTPTEVQILDDNKGVDASYPISKICAVRQHRATTCQFLVRGYGTKDAVEYGFHFPTSTDAAKFRVGLHETLFDSLEVLSSFKIDLDIYDVHAKAWRDWAKSQHFIIGRREEDGLGMVCVATPENDTLFLCELTRDFQYWPTEDAKVFTIWGPYLTLDSSSGDIHPTKYMLRFTIANDTQEDSTEVLKLFEKLVGYEEKVINVEQVSNHHIMR